jgi:SIR2-like domain
VSDRFVREQIEVLGSSGLSPYDFHPVIGSSATCAELASARRSHSLTLVLGAGISYPSALPTWNALIQEAGKAALQDSAAPSLVDLILTSYLSPIAQVRMFETILGMKSAFRSHLVRALYAHYVHRRRPKANLMCIADFIIGNGNRPSVDSVISYNFDNLLELTLELGISQKTKHFRVVPIASEETYRASIEDRTIRVFHPHGFIPYDASLNDLISMPLVFSEEDYHKHFLNQVFWANVMQASCLTSGRCLFIGSSFTDPNLRRLLDMTRGSPVKPNRIAIRALHKDTIKKGTKHVENYIMEKDLRSLGVETLWVRKNGDIPRLLRKIMVM